MIYCFIFIKNHRINALPLDIQEGNQQNIATIVNFGFGVKINSESCNQIYIDSIVSLVIGCPHCNLIRPD